MKEDFKERHPENEPIPDILVFRVEASLLYFNVEHVRETVWRKIRSGTQPVRVVVCDLSATPFVDLAGARMLTTLNAALKDVGMWLRLGRVRGSARYPSRRRPRGFTRKQEPVTFVFIPEPDP